MQSLSSSQKNNQLNYETYLRILEVLINPFSFIKLLNFVNNNYQVFKEGPREPTLYGDRICETVCSRGMNGTTVTSHRIVVHVTHNTITTNPTIALVDSRVVAVHRVAIVDAIPVVN